VSTFSLAHLPRGSNVLIDTNIFIYALSQRSAQCQELLDRCANEQVAGMTTIEVVNEVCHRLMVIEAAAVGITHRPSAISLRRKRDQIKTLTRYWILTAKIFDLDLLIIPLDEIRVRQAAEIRADYGLLTNDSMLLAAALEYGVGVIAGHDSDFERIEGLHVYKPIDVQ
jgi:predicted nucleic acid-binding protein